MFVTVIVNPVTWPRTVAVVSAVLTIDRAGARTGMVEVHAGSAVPAGQLLPGAAVTRVAVRT